MKKVFCCPLKSGMSLAAVFLTIGSIFASVSISTMSCCNHPADSKSAGRRDAVIIDQLALYDQNPEFINTVTRQLENDNFEVDVYSGNQVTIDFYRNLPSHGYEVLIFRVHAGLLGEDSGAETSGKTYIFTGEEYNVTSNTWAQLFDEISPASINGEINEVFAINSNFVRNSMNGDFNGAAIIMMGCATAYQPDMAEAFINRGASVYIGWSASVCLDYVDEATIQLIDELITKHVAIEQALTNTVNKSGLDPQYNAHPQYHPRGVGSQKINFPQP